MSWFVLAWFTGSRCIKVGGSSAQFALKLCGLWLIVDWMWLLWVEVFQACYLENWWGLNKLTHSMNKYGYSPTKTVKLHTLTVHLTVFPFTLLLCSIESPFSVPEKYKLCFIIFWAFEPLFRDKKADRTGKKEWRTCSKGLWDLDLGSRTKVFLHLADNSTANQKLFLFCLVLSFIKNRTWKDITSPIGYWGGVINTLESVCHTGIADSNLYLLKLDTGKKKVEDITLLPGRVPIKNQSGLLMKLNDAQVFSLN